MPRPARSRCHGCGHVWLACPEPEPAPVPDAAPAPAMPAPDGRLRGRWRGMASAAAGLAVVAGALWLAALAGHWQPAAVGLPPAAIPTVPATRAALVDLRLADALPHWPAARIALPELALPAIRVPEAVAPPLRIAADVTTRRLPGGGSLWDVRGTVTNPGPRSEAVPPLDIILTTDDGTEVARWTARAAATRLEPGGRATFATSAIDPPTEARHLKVRLRPASIARL